MKAELIRDCLRRAITASRQCTVPLDANGQPFVVTEATLPYCRPMIEKRVKRGEYIAVATPGACHHCHRHADLRCGVCERCVDKTYTDGVFCWHAVEPGELWALPQVDHVLRRVTF